MSLNVSYLCEYTLANLRIRLYKTSTYNKYRCPQFLRYLISLSTKIYKVGYPHRLQKWKCLLLYEGYPHNNSCLLCKLQQLRHLQHEVSVDHPETQIFEAKGPNLLYAILVYHILKVPFCQYNLQL